MNKKQRMKYYLRKLLYEDLRYGLTHTETLIKINEVANEIIERVFELKKGYYKKRIKKWK